MTVTIAPTSLSRPPRSNRPLTTLACTHLGYFLLGVLPDGAPSGQISKICGNTRVAYDEDTFTVYLYGEPVMRVCQNDGVVSSVELSFTTVYDNAGKPTCTVRERLNGLLDRLGRLGVIPEGVRVFVDQAYDIAYVGKGDDKIAIGRDLATRVTIQPRRDVLEFGSAVFALK
jgi:hypothetical protein